MPNKDGLNQLMNIGPKMVHYLSQVGIETIEDLKEIGPVEAFIRVSTLSKHLKNRMALYALYGALSDQNVNDLPDETKEWLEGELVKAGYEG
ncbi:MAG: TfoX/Sxy family protein [Rickettsiales bacterium]|nr:TfoX/Sxy family protein [Rickettsiales bacterium]